MSAITKRGRPRKPAAKRLDERVSMRLTERDKQLLQEIADFKGIAPETLIRVWVLPHMRAEAIELFGDGCSTLTA